jgi:hypothetical protein
MPRHNYIGKVMIKDIALIDERRVHRITTYLSSREVKIIKDAFEKSTIDNYSQFLRHQLLLSVNEEAKIAIVVPEINKELAIELTSCVSSLNRLIADLELDALNYEAQSESEKLNKLTSVIEYVNKVDKAAWMLAHFFKGDIQRKQVIQNMAYITLSSDDLIEMAATMISEEDFQS